MSILNILSLLLGITWRVYWYIMERPANVNKPKMQKRYIALEKILIFISAVFVVTQLFGFVALPFHNPTINAIGFLIVVAGFAECMIARHNLSDNWANSYEFQIKEKHELVTHGIYKYVRHPIYGGMFLMGAGMLLVAGSYLVVPFAVVVWGAINMIAQREENLLTRHFGKEYLKYMEDSKRFIPLIY
jgi:protein-S-isoprenylcysteine O-methyltransferase Ste14